jgi:hypothetical protein
MTFLYRFALTVTRRQPYIDWANSVDDDGPELTEELDHDRRTIYLVPEAATEPDVESLIAEFWEQIFERELSLWMDDEGTWPQARTREMFNAWFESEVTSGVCDLTPEEPLTHDDVEADDLAYAISHCAWCDVELEEGAARYAAFKLPDRTRFAARAGLVLPLAVDRDQHVTGIMSPADSDAADAGEDVVFAICSSRCEKAIRKAVPRSLRKHALR